MNDPRYYGSDKHMYMCYEGDEFSEFIYSNIHRSFCDDFDVAVELGAGMGRFSSAIVKGYSEVHLVEPNEEYAAILQSRFETAAVHASSAKNFFEGSFKAEKAVVFSFHLLHHLSSSEREYIYQWVAKTGSAYIFVEPNPFNPLIPLQILLTPEMSFKEEAQGFQLTQKRYRQELDSAGLHLEEHFYLCALPPTLMNRVLPHWPGVKRLEPLARLCPPLAAYQCCIVQGI